MAVKTAERKGRKPIAQRDNEKSVSKTDQRFVALDDFDFLASCLSSYLSWFLSASLEKPTSVRKIMFRVSGDDFSKQAFIKPMRYEVMFCDVGRLMALLKKTNGRLYSKPGNTLEISSASLSTWEGR